MPRYENIPEFMAALPEADVPIPGVTGHLLQGGTHQAIVVEFTETVDVPEHSHAEQWEFVIDGRCDLRIGGRTITHTAGDNFFVPAGVPHGATVHAGYKGLILFNAPDRYTLKAR